jgi:hypothetical protein
MAQQNADQIAAWNGQSGERFAHAVGMGKPTRNEQLAEYYRRAAGVAAVWIDAEGHVGAQDVASIEIDQDRTAYCCERGAFLPRLPAL